MKHRRLLAIVVVAIMLVGCGVEERTSSNAVEKKDEIAQVDKMNGVIDTVSGEEDEGTEEEIATEVVEKTTEETVPTEQIQPEAVQETETKETQTKAETPMVTTSELVADKVDSGQQEHTHIWEEFEKEMPHHQIWYERVGAWRTLCGRCQLDMTDMSDDELTLHVTIECNSRYYAKFVETAEPILHEETTLDMFTFVRCMECGYEVMKDTL